MSPQIPVVMLHTKTNVPTFYILFIPAGFQGSPRQDLLDPDAGFFSISHPDLARYPTYHADRTRRDLHSILWIV